MRLSMRGNAPHSNNRSCVSVTMRYIDHRNNRLNVVSRESFEKMDEYRNKTSVSNLFESGVYELVDVIVKI